MKRDHQVKLAGVCLLLIGACGGAALFALMETIGDHSDSSAAESFWPQDVDHKPSQWEEGFRDGMAYAIQKYVDGDMLKTPDAFQGREDFISCIFVRCIKMEPSIVLTGQDQTIAGCTIGDDPIKQGPIPWGADGMFERLSAKQEKGGGE